MRAKTASEILDDATLVCWFSFNSGLDDDRGPLRLKGTAVNVSFVSGRVYQAISFDSNSSYYQVSNMNCLTSLSIIHIDKRICSSWCSRYFIFIFPLDLSVGNKWINSCPCFNKYNGWWFMVYQFYWYFLNWSNSSRWLEWFTRWKNRSCLTHECLDTYCLHVFRCKWYSIIYQWNIQQ